MDVDSGILPVSADQRINPACDSITVPVPGRWQDRPDLSRDCFFINDSWHSPTALGRWPMTTTQTPVGIQPVHGIKKVLLKKQ
jgi:hypothetical protein